MTAGRPATLIETIWPAPDAGRRRAAALIAGGAVAIALSAPLGWSAQAFCATTLAAVAGARIGGGAAALAGLAALTGLALPVDDVIFAPARTPFQVGLIAAALLVGAMAGRSDRAAAWRLALAMIAGHALALGAGATGLALAARPLNAIFLGVAPAVLQSAAAAAVGFGLVTLGWRRARLRATPGGLESSHAGS